MDGDVVGLDMMAPEVMHKVALSGWLEFEDVKALALTCKRMKSIFVDDAYGRDIHYALKGVMKNVRKRRWTAARYAVRRRWFVEGKEEEKSVWRKVANVVGRRKIVATKNDLGGWESVLMAALSLPGASGWEETWSVRTKGGEEGQMSLLHVAARVGSEVVVDWVAERGGDLGVEDHEYVNPLQLASLEGQVKVVKKLVERGADVVIADPFSRDALHNACRGGDPETVRYLLSLGVFGVNEKTTFGFRPLDIACLSGNVDVIRVLLDQGRVDLNEPGDRGKTALHLVVSARKTETKGRVNMVKVLLDLGADAGIVDDKEETVLDVARRQGWDRVVRVLEEGRGGE